MLVALDNFRVGYVLHQYRPEDQQLGMKWDRGNWNHVLNSLSKGLYDSITKWIILGKHGQILIKNMLLGRWY